MITQFTNYMRLDGDTISLLYKYNASKLEREREREREREIKST